MENNSLAILGNATKMLAEVRTIDDAKQLMDIAASAKLYARKHQLGKEAVGYAKEIEIRAEIMLGTFLVLMEKNKGAAANAVEQDDSTFSPSLEELGITRNLSSESQKLARLSEVEQRMVKDKMSHSKQLLKKLLQNMEPATGR